MTRALIAEDESLLAEHLAAELLALWPELTLLPTAANGDEAFFSVLRQWFERYNGQSVTTDQFEALAAEVSKTDLSGFFAAWVHSTIVPPLPG